MRDRIMGEEIEWAGGFRSQSDNFWIPIGASFNEIAKIMRLEPEHEYDFSNNGFIANGSRIYCESTGQHFETALPECSSAREVLKYDKWSERFVCHIAEKTKDKIGELIFYKKNADSDLNYTRSCHENYFSEGIFSHLLKTSERLKNTMGQTTNIIPEVNYFILFLITRQIFSGSGGIMLYSLKDLGNDAYEISPRTYFINAVLSYNTTSAGSVGRPIINIRDEPLSQQEKYWRNHLILGDANMADLSIFLKFGTTSAVIEMIEEGFWDKNLYMDSIIKSPKILKKISEDLTLKNVPIRLKNGKDYTALQIQKKFCKNWQRYLKYTAQGGEKLEIAERWREVLDRLEIDDEKLYSQLDWKIKMRLILDFVTKKSLPLNHQKVINIDKLYHSPDPKISFYYLLKSRPGLQFEDLVSESEILDAGKTPPETRARLRSYLRKICRELNLFCCPGWDSFSLKIPNDVYDKKIYMPDPRLSSLSSLNTEENAEAINYLNTLKPNVIITQ